MPTVKNSFIFKNGEKKKEYKYSEILHKLNETVHFAIYLDIPKTRWAGDQADLHSLVL